jgi:chemotaxis protein MotB
MTPLDLVPPGAPPGAGGPAARKGVRRPARRSMSQQLAHAEAATGQETWLISYTDMVTLLLTVFVLLVSFTGLKPASPAARPVPQPAGAEAAPDVPWSDPTLPAEAPPPPRPAVIAADPLAAPAPPAEAAADAAGGTLVPNGLAWMRDRARELEELALRTDGGGGLPDGMVVQRTETAVVVQLRDNVLFAPGHADLVPAGRDVLARVAAVLAGLPGEVDVEGHTDDRPIASSRFASNWELSAARAARVARELVAAGVPAGKVRAVGYADTRPVADNGTPAGRAANRRVTLTILGRAPVEGPAQREGTP